MTVIQQTPARLTLAVCGLGRMGKQHALNALHASPRVALAAACSPLDADMKWAQEHLAPHGVHLYRSLEEMFEHTKIEALLIASTTRVHYKQVMAGLNHGYHVLVEKPLAMTVQQSRKIMDFAQQPQNKHLKVMTAFSRRFDASYMDAKQAIQSGRIGEPVVLRCENRDKYDSSDGMKTYLSANPGIFVDSAVHDIDLCLNFLGEDIRPKSCYATGSVSMHRQLDEIQDVDNAVGIVEWHPRAPGGTPPISYHYCSRIMQHGFDNPTEIIGTKGALKINQHPRNNLIDIADSNGISNSVMPDYYGRYERAFVTELDTFAQCILDNKALPYELSSAVKGMEIAQALQKSLVTGQKVFIGEQDYQLKAQI
jgi:myo-inositol 2-dehydrogenase/D-chiro-inositol 1-dehydrogenase